MDYTIIKKNDSVRCYNKHITIVFCGIDNNYQVTQKDCNNALQDTLTVMLTDNNSLHTSIKNDYIVFDTPLYHIKINMIYILSLVINI